MQFSVAQHVYGYYYRGAETRAAIDHRLALSVRETVVRLDQDTQFMVLAAGVRIEHAIRLEIREEAQFTN